MDECGAHDAYEEHEEDGCESDELHADDGDPADEEDDSDTEGDGDRVGSASSDEELEREWAATEIQHAWHAYDHHRKSRSSELSIDPLTSQTKSKKKNESVCCSCFGLIDESASASAFEKAWGDSEDDDHVFCPACLYVMARATAIGSATPPVASSLPKLSMLVQAEAKYQDQLQMLRAKQELLRQQQQEMQNRKSAEAKQLAAERALARGRRRLFQLSMERKKREEELKYQQFSNNSSPEQEDGDVSAMTSQTTVNDSSKRKIMKEMIPIPLRRTLLLATASAGIETISSPSTATRLPGLMDKKSEELQQQRKTHFLKKMIGCYAQDLTPLVNGHKPKPLPVPSHVSVATKKSQHQHQQSPSLSRASSQTKARAPASNSKKQQQQMRKSKKPGKLHPIDDVRFTRKFSNNSCNNNQHDDHESTSSSPFSSYSRLSTQPLTAEIKPVSWIYELGKGVLDEELHALTNGYQQQQQKESSYPQSLARFAQLNSVQEESSEPTDIRASFDLHLQHKLPSKTVLAPSSSLTALPSALATNNVSMGQQQQQQPPQWEYSPDRLAGLLEKYNVSVTTATK